MLQADGRVQNVIIARRMGLTPPCTLRRLKALEENGLVRGYRAQLEPDKLGYPVLAFLRVALDPGIADRAARFDALVQDTANVRESHALAAGREYLMKCLFPSVASAQRFVTDTLLRTDFVLSVTSSFCIRTTKYEPGVPLGG